MDPSIQKAASECQLQCQYLYAGCVLCCAALRYAVLRCTVQLGTRQIESDFPDWFSLSRISYLMSKYVI